MPSPDVILTGLATMANEWRWLAIVWHVVLAALFVTLVAGWRPSIRLLGHLLVAPIVSVSLVAWLSGNPFNGTVLAILAAVLVAAVVSIPDTSVRLASPSRVASGVAFLAFGSAYPHFVGTTSWIQYLYASPFGILPCPTLSTVIGFTLIFANLGASSWSRSLVFAGLLFGLIGVFRLAVALDWGLLAASLTLAAILAHNVISSLDGRTTAQSSLDMADHRRPTTLSGVVTSDRAD